MTALASSIDDPIVTARQGPDRGAWNLDAVTLGAAHAAAFLIGFGIYPRLYFVTLALAALAIALRIRHFRLDAWRVGFLALLVLAFVWYRWAYILPEATPPDLGVPAWRTHGVTLAYVVAGFLLASTAGSQARAVRVAILISFGLLAKATMILVTTVLTAPPPYYLSGGYDPLNAIWINPNNINDMALYATWSLIAFVLFSRGDFSRSDYVAGVAVALWSIIVGVAFGGRTFVVITILAFVAMAVRNGGIRRRWRVLLVGLLAFLALNLAVFVIVPFYRAGLEMLAYRLWSSGLSSSRLQLYWSWLSQVVADPFGRPVVDIAAFGTMWFHNLWMDADRTSGLAAMLLLSAVWVLPFVRLAGPLRANDRRAWAVLVALSSATILSAFSVPIEGANTGGLAYFAAIAAVVLALRDGERDDWLRARGRALWESVAGRQMARRYAANTAWMLSEQVLRLIAGLLVGIYVARYLEPAGYGLYSYAVAFAGIFAAFARLGLDAVVVRDLVTHRERQGDILGSSFWLKVLGGVAAAMLVLVSLPFSSGGDPLTAAAVAIVGISIIFQAFDVADLFFQAEVRSKYSSICKIVQLSVSVAVRLGLIAANADVIWFAAAVFVDQLTLAAAYTVAMWRQKILPVIRVYSDDTAAALLRSSWPLIISGVAILLYMRIDQVMINGMLGASAVGSYAAAVRIAEVFYFAPMVITASVFPWLVAARQKSEGEFRAATSALLDVMTILGLAIAIPLFFLSDWIILRLFGPAFADAAGVLKISAWVGLFVFSGLVAQQWVVARDQTWQSMIRSIAGAICNIALNLVLIPRMGINGAAIATLVSQALASIVLNAAFADSRPVFVLQLKSLVLPGVHLAAYLRHHRRPQMLRPVPAPALEPTPW